MRIHAPGLITVVGILAGGLISGCQPPRPGPEAAPLAPAEPDLASHDAAPRPGLDAALSAFQGFGRAVIDGDVEAAEGLSFGKDSSKELLKEIVGVRRSSNAFRARLVEAYGAEAGGEFPRYAEFLSACAVGALGGPHAALLNEEVVAGAQVNLTDDKAAVTLDGYDVCSMVARNGQWQIDLDSGQTYPSAAQQAIMLKAFQRMGEIHTELAAGITAENLTAEQMETEMETAFSNDPILGQLQAAIVQAAAEKGMSLP